MQAQRRNRKRKLPSQKTILWLSTVRSANVVERAGVGVLPWVPSTHLTRAVKRRWHPRHDRRSQSAFPDTADFAALIKSPESKIGRSVTAISQPGSELI